MITAELMVEWLQRRDTRELKYKVSSTSREYGKVGHCGYCGHVYDHLTEHDSLVHYAPCDYCDGNHATCSHRD